MPWQLWCGALCLSMVSGSGLLAQNESDPSRPAVATSLLGQPLVAPKPAAQLLERLEQHRLAYEAQPDNPDKLIWLARFLAYAGDYEAAIQLYSDGIRRFPDDARMYRHRGHRLITLRQFDRALADFQQAVQLIEGQSNQIEPDGMPNAQNIPVSSLQGNIWYHKGLVHYLQDDLPAALAAFTNCLNLKSNDDNTVSATHWIYMILRRMDRLDEARSGLAIIESDMNIIENFSYHRACLFYKGELSLSDIQAEPSTDPPSPADDSLRYAIANWHWYNGEKETARKLMDEVIAGGTWASFGHIAAEADVARMKASRATGDRP